MTYTLLLLLIKTLEYYEHSNKQCNSNLRLCVLNIVLAETMELKENEINMIPEILFY